VDCRQPEPKEPNLLLHIYSDSRAHNLVEIVSLTPNCHDDEGACHELHACGVPSSRALFDMYNITSMLSVAL